jgi:hypothetical protein
VWVGQPGLDPDTLPKNHGMKYEIKERPQELFGKLLREFGFMEQTQNKEQSLMTDLGNLWSKPKPNFTPNFVPFLHCELQLISYLDRRNITVHINLIGVSKLMCWACNVYVKEVNKRRKDDRKEPYNVLSGASDKVHHAWLIPPGELRDVVVEIVHDALKVAISNLAQELGHERIHGGSDSPSSYDSVLELPLDSDDEMLLKELWSESR